MSIFNENSKVIIIGDRDGIPGPAMEECVKTTPAEIVFQQLSVLSELHAGAKGHLENQRRVKELTEKYGAKTLSY